MVQLSRHLLILVLALVVLVLVLLVLFVLVILCHTVGAAATPDHVQFVVFLLELIRVLRVVIVLLLIVLQLLLFVLLFLGGVVRVLGSRWVRCPVLLQDVTVQQGGQRRFTGGMSGKYGKDGWEPVGSAAAAGLENWDVRLDKRVCWGVSRTRYQPVTGGALRRGVAVVVERIHADRFRRLLEVVERGVERQTGAHPQEHAGTEPVAGRPEVVLAVAGVLQVLGHRFHLLLRLERGELQAERAAVLVGEEVVQLRRVRVHPADEVLHTVQLDGGDPLSYGCTGRKEGSCSRGTTCPPRRHPSPENALPAQSTERTASKTNKMQTECNKQHPNRNRRSTAERGNVNKANGHSHGAERVATGTGLPRFISKHATASGRTRKR
uniref:Uncharacterized protein n=1 Tax=Anopheles farauti TaxID=69004 RepID=A0A182Q2V1_9DIPT